MNYSAASFTVNENNGKITIESKSAFSSMKDAVKLLEISINDGEIEYFSEHIIYEAFSYEKPNEKFNPDHYAAYLRYSGNSSGEEQLKLICYEQFKYDIAYDVAKDIFVDAEIGSSTIGKEMIFKKDLDKQLQIAYPKLIERDEKFNEDLNKLIKYIESEIFVDE